MWDHGSRDAEVFPQHHGSGERHRRARTATSSNRQHDEVGTDLWRRAPARGQAGGPGPAAARCCGWPTSTAPPAPSCRPAAAQTTRQQLANFLLSHERLGPLAASDVEHQHSRLRDGDMQYGELVCLLVVLQRQLGLVLRLELGPGAPHAVVLGPQPHRRDRPQPREEHGDGLQQQAGVVSSSQGPWQGQQQCDIHL
jgi:hypothetical protein